MYRLVLCSCLDCCHGSQPATAASLQPASQAAQDSPARERWFARSHTTSESRRDGTFKHRLRRTPQWMRFPSTFPHHEKSQIRTLRSVCHEKLRASRILSGWGVVSPEPSCTISGQPFVDRLHSAENKQVRKREMWLTAATGGVKTQSFFDSFLVFPVGAASGAQARSLWNLQRINRGSARVYSKALVEENERPRRRQDRIPRR